MNYDFDRVNAQLDNITFDEWAVLRKVDQAFYDILYRPIIQVTVNKRETVSATYSHPSLPAKYSVPRGANEYSRYPSSRSTEYPWYDYTCATTQLSAEAYASLSSCSAVQCSAVHCTRQAGCACLGSAVH
jgi:hypothetical protein